MSTEVALRVTLLFLTVVIYGVRLRYELRIPKTKTLVGGIEVALIVAMCVWAVSLFVYPWGFWWFEFPLPVPAWVRWLGALCMAASLPLSIWVYESLGIHFSTKLQVTKDHRLVTKGPYRFVRHPMYATFFLCALGASITAANGIIVVTSAVPVTIMLVRRHREEALLTERFGDEYREYRQKTGALLPKLLQ